MENAKSMEDRLKRIINDISRRTGSELKTITVDQFTRQVDASIKKNNEEQLIKVLTLLKKAINDIR